MILYQWEPEGLVRRHVGTVSADELARSDAHVRADPRGLSLNYLIEDFRRCGGLVFTGLGGAATWMEAPSPAGLLTVAPTLPGQIRHVAVSPGNLFQSMGEWLAALGPHYRKVRRFSFMSDARDWLSAPPAGV